MPVNYTQIYDHDYFNGKKSFFWRGGYGGYGGLSKKYFDNLYKPLISFVHDLPDKARILDIGCAYGFMLERFPQTFQKYGVDVSEHAIGIAKKRLPQAQFKVVQVEKGLPFAKNFFDLVICNDVLEHLEKPELLLKHVKTVLKPGGIFYVTTPNLNLIRRIFFAYADKMEHHISLMPHTKLLQMFNAAGFTVVNRWTFFHLYFYIPCNGDCGVESAVVARK